MDIFPPFLSVSAMCIKKNTPLVGCIVSVPAVDKDCLVIEIIEQVWKLRDTEGRVNIPRIFVSHKKSRGHIIKKLRE